MTDTDFGNATINLQLVFRIEEAQVGSVDTLFFVQKEFEHIFSG